MISANGKVILFGEHAVVYGYKALAVGIPEGIKAQKVLPLENLIELRVKEWGVVGSSAIDDELGNALSILGKKIEGIGGCQVFANAKIPAGAGLGSSAAVSVLMAKCIRMIRKKEGSLEQIRMDANSAEEVFHKNPSGLDTAVAVYGGICLYQRHGKIDVKNGKQIEPNLVLLDLRCPDLIIGNSMIPHKTSEMVKRVRDAYDRSAVWVRTMFERIESCVLEGVEALRNKDISSLGRLMLKNHHILSNLGVSCTEVEKMVDLAIKAGALGAKITGAGGGGAVVAVAPNKEDNVMKAWKDAGFDCFLIRSER